MNTKKDEKEFCRLPIKIVKKDGHKFNFDIYLKLGESKIVKMAHGGEDFRDVIERYEQKGLKEVLVVREHYNTYLATYKQNIQNMFFDPATITHEKVELLSDSHQIIKESLSGLGLTEEAIELAKEVNTKCVQLVQEVPNIFKFLQDFKNNCSDEFMEGLMVSYTTSAMINKFVWNSASIKEKLSMASMLCDITLSKDEIQEMKKGMSDPASLSEKVRRHPREIAELLGTESNDFAKETLIVIEQHHERPNGQGFPGGISHQNINLLSAIYIVAYEFIILMFENNFDFSKRNVIISKLKKDFQKGNFKKALDSLLQTIGM